MKHNVQNHKMTVDFGRSRTTKSTTKMTYISFLIL